MSTATRTTRTAPDCDPVCLAEAFARVRKAWSAGPARNRARSSAPDRRSVDRVVLHVPVLITSAMMVGGSARLICGGVPGEAIDISPRGLSFTHPGPFPHYFAAITFTLPTFETVSFLVEILWTMQETKESFRSGARFIGLVDPI